MREYLTVIGTHIAWTLGIFLIATFYLGPMVLKDWLVIISVVAVGVAVMMYTSKDDN